MMGLDTLIRLHRLRLDDQGRQIAALQARMAELTGNVEKLEADVVAEQQRLGDSNEPAFGIGAYISAGIDRRRALGVAIAEQAAEVETARAELHRVFQEVKRYELARDNRARRERREIERREQTVADEIAINGFRRRAAG